MSAIFLCNYPPPPLPSLQILDYTSPLDSDYMDLKSALERATTLCEHVNDGVMQKENTEQLEWLQSHVAFTNLEEKIVFNSQTNFMGPRKLLHHGKFFKVWSANLLVYSSPGFTCIYFVRFVDLRTSLGSCLMTSSSWSGLSYFFLWLPHLPIWSLGERTNSNSTER